MFCSQMEWKRKKPTIKQVEPTILQLGNLIETFNLVVKWNNLFCMFHHKKFSVWRSDSTQRLKESIWDNLSMKLKLITRLK